MKNFAFLPAQRMSKKSDITQVFSQGKKVFGGGYKAFLFKNQLSYPRLCIIIAKKQIASAVLRNKIKRLVRESFRLTQLPPLDVIVIIYSKVLDMTKQQFKSELNRLWDISRRFLVS